MGHGKIIPGSSSPTWPALLSLGSSLHFFHGLTCSLPTLVRLYPAAQNKISLIFSGAQFYMGHVPALAVAILRRAMYTGEEAPRIWPEFPYVEIESLLERVQLK